MHTAGWRVHGTAPLRTPPAGALTGTPLPPALPQVKWVAAPPRPKDITSMAAQGLFVHYSVLATGSYELFE